MQGHILEVTDTELMTVLSYLLTPTMISGPEEDKEREMGMQVLLYLGQEIIPKD